MAIRKTTRTRTPAIQTPPVETPVAPAPKPRRSGAPRRAKSVNVDVPAGLTIAPPSDEEIRVRAYFLSLERGGPSVDPTADWLRAEQELVAGRAVGADSTSSGA